MVIDMVRVKFEDPNGERVIIARRDGTILDITDDKMILRDKNGDPEFGEDKRYFGFDDLIEGSYFIRRVTRTLREEIKQLLKENHKAYDELEKKDEQIYEQSVKLKTFQNIAEIKVKEKEFKTPCECGECGDKPSTVKLKTNDFCVEDMINGK